MPNRENLAEFIDWCKTHITGDEKGQSQIFLDRLFQAFDQPGCLDVGGTTEFRIRKAQEQGGGTAFADYVWKPVVLIEMKKRGENLQKHYRQAFDYWIRLVPNRPRYVVLCNFDEFRVYDFDTDLDTPKDTVTLNELSERWGPLAFLAPGNPKPNFENDRVAVTKEAADKLADCFKSMVSKDRKPQIGRSEAQRFILQMLVALFAQSIDLLPKHFVTNLLVDCKTPTDSYELLGGLFRAMNQSRPASGGRYKEVPFFNGGLFANPAQIEIQDLELFLLREAAKFNWKRVQPEVFGTLFQHSMDDEERHSFGAHFTSPSDIMKIVGPTIVEPWREQVENAKTLKRLYQLTERLHHFRVLDPACGSGNFLYIAYRELKRLEARIFERMEVEFRSEAKKSDQIRLSFLSAQNFFGIDILPFAVEIAKVTMMIARKLAIDELHITEQALPLDNLDKNFIAADALLTPQGLPFQWPKADVIIGNPPFLGAKLLRPARGPDYVNKLRRSYPEVPGMADYCVYWFRKAQDNLPDCNTLDPVAGRAGLVGTQNIRNNQSRVGGLDYITKNSTVVEAVENQPWSGEANVHVSIANWVKTRDPALLPKLRKLWFKVEPLIVAKKLRKRRSGVAEKDYELNFRECEEINSALSDKTDVSRTNVLVCNTSPQRVFQGITPGHKSFLLTKREADDFIRKNENNRTVIFPYLIGDEILTDDGTPTRYVLDFQQKPLFEAQTFAAPFAHVQAHVLPARTEAAEKGKDAEGNMRPHHKQFLERWWKLSWDRADMIGEIDKISRYLVCSRVTKRPVFVFVHKSIRPGDALQVFIFDDDYSFGILQSHAHWLWFTTKCSKLTERFRYTPDTVFDTFPWPQSATVKQIDAVATAGRELQQVRATALMKIKGGLRALYRILELPGTNPLKDIHAELDAAVLNAYGFSSKKDLLTQLLVLNQEIASKIESGSPVIVPGVPKNYPDGSRLVTKDCIKPMR